MSLDESKRQLRSAMASRLKACSTVDLETASTRICNTLESMSLNGIIMAYLPMPDEVDLTPYLQTRLEIGVAVPIVDWNSHTMHPGLLSGLESPHVIPGKHGVQSPADDHPVPLEQLEVVLVPGIAFDLNGHRLGRGGGFYDRFLEALPSECVTIGIAFDEQVVETVPIEPWDRQLHRVVTPRGVFNRP